MNNANTMISVEFNSFSVKKIIGLNSVLFKYFHGNNRLHPKIEDKKHGFVHQVLTVHQ